MFVAFSYSNNIVVVATKNCNILFLVVIKSYHDAQNICGEKFLQQYKHFVVIVYINKIGFGGARYLSQQARGSW
jgi:hypothetical protein